MLAATFDLVKASLIDWSAGFSAGRPSSGAPLVAELAGLFWANAGGAIRKEIANRQAS